jgi:hypothetical protein
VDEKTKIIKVCKREDDNPLSPTRILVQTDIGLEWVCVSIYDTQYIQRSVGRNSGNQYTVAGEYYNVPLRAVRRWESKINERYGFDVFNSVSIESGEPEFKTDENYMTALRSQLSAESANLRDGTHKHYTLHT